MDELAAGLERLGLRSELLGPEQEWSPVPVSQYQRRHAAFWGLVDDVIHSEPGDYDDLPSWMTEDATNELAQN